MQNNCSMFISPLDHLSNGGHFYVDHDGAKIPYDPSIPLNGGLIHAPALQVIYEEVKRGDEYCLVWLSKRDGEWVRNYVPRSKLR